MPVHDNNACPEYLLACCFPGFNSRCSTDISNYHRASAGSIWNLSEMCLFCILSSALQVVTAHSPGVKMASVHDGQPVLQGVRCLALRRHNTELVSAGADGKICFWDIAAGKVGKLLQTYQVAWALRYLVLHILHNMCAAGADAVTVVAGRHLASKSHWPAGLWHMLRHVAATISAAVNLVVSLTPVPRPC